MPSGVAVPAAFPGITFSVFSPLVMSATTVPPHPCLRLQALDSEEAQLSQRPNIPQTGSSRTGVTDPPAQPAMLQQTLTVIDVSDEVDGKTSSPAAGSLAPPLGLIDPRGPQTADRSCEQSQRASSSSTSSSGRVPMPDAMAPVDLQDESCTSTVDGVKTVNETHPVSSAVSPSHSPVHIGMDCSCRVVRCDAVRCDAVFCGMGRGGVGCCDVMGSLVRCLAVLCGMVRCGAVRCGVEEEVEEEEHQHRSHVWGGAALSNPGPRGRKEAILSFLRQSKTFLQNTRGPPLAGPSR